MWEESRTEVGKKKRGHMADNGQHPLCVGELSLSHAFFFHPFELFTRSIFLLTHVHTMGRNIRRIFIAFSRMNGCSLLNVEKSNRKKK